MRVAAKLPFASVARAPVFMTSEADWKRIERAYGTSVPISLREEICAISNDFLYWASFESAAPPASQAVDRINSIRTAAANLRTAILCRAQNQSGIADFYAKHFISKGAGLQSHDGRSGLDHLAWGMLLDIIRGCNLAVAELQHERGAFRQGAAWDGWVRKLTKSLLAYNLPIAVRKDVDKQKGGPSPFVAFVRELQKSIPPKVQHSAHSDGALAQAIYGARAAQEPKTSKRARTRRTRP